MKLTRIIASVIMPYGAFLATTNQLAPNRAWRRCRIRVISCCCIQLRGPLIHPLLISCCHLILLATCSDSGDLANPKRKGITRKAKMAAGRN